MNLNVEILKANVDVLEERLKKINHRLYIKHCTVKFRDIDDTDFWNSVGKIYGTDAYIKSQDDTPDKEWQAIPHDLVLQTVKEWQEEFGKIEETSNDGINVNNIPNLKHNQLRLNIHGELCLLVKYSCDDNDIRAWNLSRNDYECVGYISYADEEGTNEAWKNHLPKVIIENVSKLQGVAQALQI